MRAQITIFYHVIEFLKECENLTILKSTYICVSKRKKSHILYYYEIRVTYESSKTDTTRQETEVFVIVLDLNIQFIYTLDEIIVTGMRTAVGF